jgi:hypothetical protein
VVKAAATVYGLVVDLVLAMLVFFYVYISAEVLSHFSTGTYLYFTLSSGEKISVRPLVETQPLLQGSVQTLPVQNGGQMPDVPNNNGYGGNLTSVVPPVVNGV